MKPLRSAIGLMLAVAAVHAAVILLLLGASCAGKREFTVADQPASQEVQNAGNRIYNMETWLVVGGELLLNARAAGFIPDQEWDEIADISDDVNEALGEARQALLDYESRAADLGKVTKALIAMDVVAALWAERVLERGTR